MRSTTYYVAPCDDGSNVDDGSDAESGTAELDESPPWPTRQRSATIYYVAEEAAGGDAEASAEATMASGSATADERPVATVGNGESGGNRTVVAPTRQVPMRSTTYYVAPCDDGSNVDDGSDAESGTAELDESPPWPTRQRSATIYYVAEEAAGGDAEASAEATMASGSATADERPVATVGNGEAVTDPTANTESASEHLRVVCCQLLIDGTPRHVKFEVSEEDTPSSLALELLAELAANSPSRGPLNLECSRDTLRDLVYQIEQALEKGAA